MLLKNNMQPTDFADSECRVSEWVEPSGAPWAGSLVVAYRVWECRCSAYWFHRHEWLKQGENQSQMDDWQFYGYHPRRTFAAHMKPAPNLEDV